MSFIQRDIIDLQLHKTGLFTGYIVEIFAYLKTSLMLKVLFQNLENSGMKFIGKTMNILSVYIYLKTMGCETNVILRNMQSKKLEENNPKFIHSVKTLNPHGLNAVYKSF